MLRFARAACATPRPCARGGQRSALSLSRPSLGAAGAPTRRFFLAPSPSPLSVARATSGGGGGASGGGGSGGSGGGGGDDGQQPHPLRPFTFAYAAFLLAGGIIAYVKSSSTKSLTAAGGSAVVLAFAANAMKGGPAAVRAPLVVVAVMSALLAYVMGKRYAKTKKVMPAGVTAGLSFGMALAAASQVAGIAAP